MKKQMVDIYFEELIMVALHPKRISAWLDAGFEDFSIIKSHLKWTF
jgi:hypothetical protein